MLTLSCPSNEYDWLAAFIFSANPVMVANAVNDYRIFVMHKEIIDKAKCTPPMGTIGCHLLTENSFSNMEHVVDGQVEALRERLRTENKDPWDIEVVQADIGCRGAVEVPHTVDGEQRTLTMCGAHLTRFVVEFKEI